ncbi:MAG: glycosyltransferase family 4 protein [Actinomycetota bacterium]|nr:glycosyltransferase family 4 protein [Actinomycetota bacterium]
MRVLLDARIHRPFKTGIGRYIESLGLALARREDVDLTLAVTRGSSGEKLAHDHGIDVFYAGHSRRPLMLGRTDFDLFHATYPIIAPVIGVPVVVTVLDLIYDDPRWAGPAKRAAFRALTATLLRSCRAALAISQATADDLVRRRKPRCLVRVTPMGVETLNVVPVSNRLSREFLYVGSLRPHKGIAVLLKAMCEAPNARLTVLSSESTEQWPRISKELSASARARVSFQPFADDATRQDLLAKVAAVVVPSHVEGFGLPVIEALAAGTPVICSDIPVFREVADTHATFFPVGDHEALARALETAPVLRNTDAAARGQRHATKFTWDRCAALTSAAYRTALSTAPL